MEGLNYHHLRYFWTVAREGSITRASVVLRVAKPTISGQLHRLEAALGERLFLREGRRLVLSEAGQVAFQYAEEIFSLGAEFLDTVKGRGGGRPCTCGSESRNRFPNWPCVGCSSPRSAFPSRFV